MFPVRTAYKRGHLSMLQCNVGVVTPTYDLCFARVCALGLRAINLAQARFELDLLQKT
jgi:hypothetical protein